MKIITISKARTNLHKIFEDISKTNSPIMITWRSNNMILVPEKKWKEVVRQNEKK